ncbi:DUF3592 domain-containing protein [Lysobacter brunescens]|uniref:DUF3592 domain-containing protein n=1 Tax=Lysobacter brunescens TaxID=262323 RepID=A0ABW2YF35_9GAMM
MNGAVISPYVWLALAIFVFAAVATAWAWQQYRLGEASRRWRRTEGTVVDIWFDVRETSDGDGGTDVSTSAHLVYDYVVNGQHYRSRRFTYRPSRGLGEREAYALLSGITRGQRVEVRYDPRRPQRAVVLTGTDAGNLWRIAICAVVACIALAYAALRLV